jgi:2-polyprenyl-6-methoxyphenol hydroxylase-like FAD-dependent oxidoreductase
MAPDAYDMVVVGARCAGAPLATSWPGAGSRWPSSTAPPFPSDTLSTHIFQASGIAVLGRLGVVGRLLASGAPWLAEAVVRVEDVVSRRSWPTEPGDPGPGLCVRRPVLDSVLVEAGADVRPATRATGLVERDGRVAGVIAESPSGDVRLEAPLVVGADGRGSTVARLIGARTYNVAPNQRFGFWAYTRGPPRSGRRRCGSCAGTTSWSSRARPTAASTWWR